MITTQANGQPLSSNYSSVVREDSRDFIAALYVDGSLLSCDIVKLQVDKGSCSGAVFTLGSVVASKLTLVVQNLTDDIKGKDIDCQVGLDTGSGYEFVRLGIFTASEVSKTRYQTTITGYSSIVSKTGAQFELLDLTSYRLDSLVNAIASQTGLTIIADSSIDQTVALAQYPAGCTVYMLLEAIAICAGGYAVNDANGNILIKQYNSSPDLSVDTGQMVNLPEAEEQDFTLNSVLAQVSEATVDYEGNPVSAIYYSALRGYLITQDGEYLTDQEANQFLVDTATDNADISFYSKYVSLDAFNQNIKNAIGYTYRPATIDLSLGDPRLEGFDVLEVTDVDGAAYLVPCHEVSHIYDGGLRTSIKAIAAPEKSNDIGTALPITAQLQGLSQAIKQSADLISGNSGGYIVIKTNERGFPEELLILDTGDIETAQNVWRWNQTGLGHSSNGYMGPYEDVALTMDGQVIAKRGKIADFDITNKYLEHISVPYYTRLYADKIGFRYLYENLGYYGLDLSTSGITFYSKMSEFPSDIWDDTQPVFASLHVSGENMYFEAPSTLFISGYDVYIYRYITTYGVTTGTLNTTGTKKRIVDTENYGTRSLYCYETPTPMFADVGEAVLGDDGLCYVEIDDIFRETIEARQEYQVFLQKEGAGDCWIKEKRGAYFVIEGTPGLKVAWELKAKQRDYDWLRMEQHGDLLDEYTLIDENDNIVENFIREQEGLLYGEY